MPARIAGRMLHRSTTRTADAAEAVRLKAQSFMIDGEAVVIGRDGVSRFEELRRREGARTALVYAFDLIEHDGEDLSLLYLTLND
jgi:bifunctional non-homologous end joining protein LigD